MSNSSPTLLLGATGILGLAAFLIFLGYLSNVRSGDDAGLGYFAGGGICIVIWLLVVLLIILSQSGGIGGRLAR